MPEDICSLRGASRAGRKSPVMPLLTLSVLAKNSPIHDQKADKMGILVF
jgi:hypothetical protein